jgi:hypothetical protein
MGCPKPTAPSPSSTAWERYLKMIMATRLAHIAAKYHLLYHLQNEGRPKRSAVDAVMQLTSMID